MGVESCSKRSWSKTLSALISHLEGCILQQVGPKRWEGALGMVDGSSSKRMDEHSLHARPLRIVVTNPSRKPSNCCKWILSLANLCSVSGGYHRHVRLGQAGCANTGYWSCRGCVVTQRSLTKRLL
eukprot:1764319-Amphidinium_carterae.1